MKVQLISDLHVVNYEQVYGPRWWSGVFLPQLQTDADVLVLAGDCFSLVGERPWDDSKPWDARGEGSAVRRARAKLEELGCRYRKVIYIPGNHEFYGTSIGAGMGELAAMEARTFGLSFLCPGKVVQVGDKRFLGGVGFQPAPREPALPISDHQCINGFSDDAPQVFAETLKWLKAQVKPGDIVVTHHAPSVQSLAPQFANSPINHWFITPEFEEVIKANRPSYWLHGHTHTPFDYQLEQTRVLCNPLGYPGERVKADMNLVFEV